MWLSGSSISSHRGCSRPKFPELHHELGGHQWNDTHVHLRQVGKAMDGEGVVGGPGVQAWWECGGNEDLEPFKAYHDDTGKCC